MNTIFAQCSGFGKAGVTVFRVSGTESAKALEILTQKPITSLKPRTAYLRKIFHPQTGNQIDEAIVIYFQDKSSFTGEDCVEIHAHGSYAVIKLLNQALTSISGLRLAEPGEFAKRAFLNGKLDLTRAEGLADLIEAETEQQHKQAIRQLEGGLEQLYNSWRQMLLTIIALLEAYIDFPDEDIPEATLAEINHNITDLISQITLHLNDNNRGERLRSGLKLAIIGQPNVGKSSLLNRFLKREAAIVSSIAGTTRDVIEGHLDINGYPVIIQDTAGIRDGATDQIEQIGINKSKEALAKADIKIIIYDLSGDMAEQADQFQNLVDDYTIIVYNKADLYDKKLPENNSANSVYISAKHGDNIDSLIEKIAQIAARLASPSESPQITRERHRAQLAKAIEALTMFNLDGELVLAAEDIRMTIRYLSNITGVITVDEILGEIFGKFCIGK